MLIGLSPLSMLMAGAAGVTIVDEYFSFDTGDRSTYPFDDIPIVGSYTHLLMVGGVRAAAMRTLSAFTVDGAAATYVGRQQATGETVELWVKEHTGASIDVSFTASGGCVAGGLGLIAVNGLKSLTPTAGPVTDTNDPIDLNVAVEAGGVIIAGSLINDATGLVWTGLDSLGDAGEGSSAAFSAAARAFAAAASPQAVQADWTSNPARAVGIAAAFR